MFDPNEVNIGDTLTVTVTPEDSALPASYMTTAFDCPFARAVCRKFGFSTGDMIAGVSHMSTELFHSELLPLATCWKHPETLHNAIRAWDVCHDPIPAGEYVLTCTRRYPD